jgi:hypothetical protein
MRRARLHAEWLRLRRRGPHRRARPDLLARLHPRPTALDDALAALAAAVP